MNKSSKLISLFLALVLTLSLSVSAFAADGSAAGKDIVVLYTSDVHCAADDNIGYAGLTAYKTDMQKAGAYVSLVDAGDAIQGGVLGTLSKGTYPVEIMNKAGYDAAVPGNHEFDFGMDPFMALSKLLTCGYVCCNFMNLKTGKPVFDSYKMISYGSTKIAYVGIDTPESISKSTPTYFQDSSGTYIYGFCSGNNGRDLYNAVQTAIDAAKAAGADYVVAVGHCGTDEQSAPWRSTDIIANVTGLSAFIDGHSHSVIPKQEVTDKNGYKVLLTSSGTKLAAIGKLVIKADGSLDSTLVTDYKTKDETMTAFIKSIKNENQTLLDTVVAKSDIKLTTLNPDGTRAVRSKETNLGDLCADAYRVIGGADIGWVNGGGVRADIAAGTVTYGQIINVFPYNNALCVVEATGQEIIDALEMAARVCPSENGGFLQVSGLTYQIDTTIPSSVKVDDNKMFVSVDGKRRVDAVKVLNKVTGAYEPIDPAKTYSLACHDYMLKSGGDGINMFMNNKLLKDCTMLDNQVLIEYITKNLGGSIGSAYAAAQSRISVKYKVSYLFPDVAAGAWYEAYVQNCWDKKLMTGVSVSAFEPEAALSRAMLVTMLYRLSGSPSMAGRVSSVFGDCDDGAWYANAVLWAAKNGITEGVGAALFAPDETLTREQMAVMLYRYAVYQGTKTQPSTIRFSDAAAVSEWALSGVAYCAAAGIMGVGETNFDPAGAASRAMGAAVLTRIAA